MRSVLGLACLGLLVVALVDAQLEDLSQLDSPMTEVQPTLGDVPVFGLSPDNQQGDPGAAFRFQEVAAQTDAAADVSVDAALESGMSESDMLDDAVDDGEGADEEVDAPAGHTPVISDKIVPTPGFKVAPDSSAQVTFQKPAAKQAPAAATKQAPPKPPTPTKKVVHKNPLKHKPDIKNIKVTPKAPAKSKDLTKNATGLAAEIAKVHKLDVAAQAAEKNRTAESLAIQQSHAKHMKKFHAYHAAHKETVQRVNSLQKKLQKTNKKLDKTVASHAKLLVKENADFAQHMAKDAKEQKKIHERQTKEKKVKAKRKEHKDKQIAKEKKRKAIRKHKAEKALKKRKAAALKIQREKQVKHQREFRKKQWALKEKHEKADHARWWRKLLNAYHHRVSDHLAKLVKPHQKGIGSSKKKKKKGKSKKKKKKTLTWQKRYELRDKKEHARWKHRAKKAKKEIKVKKAIFKKNHKGFDKYLGKEKKFDEKSVKKAKKHFRHLVKGRKKKLNQWFAKHSQSMKVLKKTLDNEIKHLKHEENSERKAKNSNFAKHKRRLRKELHSKKAARIAKENAWKKVVNKEHAHKAKLRGEKRKKAMKKAEEGAKAHKKALQHELSVKKKKRLAKKRALAALHRKLMKKLKAAKEKKKKDEIRYRRKEKKAKHAAMLKAARHRRWREKNKKAFHERANKHDKTVAAEKKTKEKAKKRIKAIREKAQKHLDKVNKERHHKGKKPKHLSAKVLKQIQSIKKHIPHAVHKPAPHLTSKQEFKAKQLKYLRLQKKKELARKEKKKKQILLANHRDAAAVTHSLMRKVFLIQRLDRHRAALYAKVRRVQLRKEKVRKHRRHARARHRCWVKCQSARAKLESTLHKVKWKCHFQHTKKAREKCSAAKAPRLKKLKAAVVKKCRKCKGHNSARHPTVNGNVKIHVPHFGVTPKGLRDHCRFAHKLSAKSKQKCTRTGKQWLKWQCSRFSGKRRLRNCRRARAGRAKRVARCRKRAERRAAITCQKTKGKLSATLCTSLTAKYHKSKKYFKKHIKVVCQGTHRVSTQCHHGKRQRTRELRALKKAMSKPCADVRRRNQKCKVALSTENDMIATCKTATCVQLAIRWGARACWGTSLSAKQQKKCKAAKHAVKKKVPSCKGNKKCLHTLGNVIAKSCGKIGRRISRCKQANIWAKKASAKCANAACKHSVEHTRVLRCASLASIRRRFRAARRAKRLKRQQKRRAARRKERKLRVKQKHAKTVAKLAQFTKYCANAKAAYKLRVHMQWAAAHAKKQKKKKMAQAVHRGSLVPVINNMYYTCATKLFLMRHVVRIGCRHKCHHVKGDSARSKCNFKCEKQGVAAHKVKRSGAASKRCEKARAQAKKLEPRCHKEAACLSSVETVKKAACRVHMKNLRQQHGHAIKMQCKINCGIRGNHRAATKAEKAHQRHCTKACIHRQLKFYYRSHRAAVLSKTRRHKKYRKRCKDSCKWRCHTPKGYLARGTRQRIARDCGKCMKTCFKKRVEQYKKGQVRCHTRCKKKGLCAKQPHNAPPVIRHASLVVCRHCERVCMVKEELNVERLSLNVDLSRKIGDRDIKRVKRECNIKCSKVHCNPHHVKTAKSLRVLNAFTILCTACKGKCLAAKLKKMNDLILRRTKVHPHNRCYITCKKACHYKRSHKCRLCIVGCAERFQRFTKGVCSPNCFKGCKRHPKRCKTCMGRCMSRPNVQKALNIVFNPHTRHLNKAIRLGLKGYKVKKHKTINSSRAKLSFAARLALRTKKLKRKETKMTKSYEHQLAAKLKRRKLEAERAKQKLRQKVARAKKKAKQVKKKLRKH